MRKRKASSKIRGGAAEAYGAGAGQDSPRFGKKNQGLRVHKGHGKSRKQRKIAGGRM